MKRMPTFTLIWIHMVLASVTFISSSESVEWKNNQQQQHLRHSHTALTTSTYRRLIRADNRNKKAIEGVAKNYVQLYSNQHVKLTLECAVNINFSTSIWLKDGQIVATILKDNANNKRVSGHRFLVDNVGNLLIDNVRLEDDGQWLCEAEDPFGFVVNGKPIQLTVVDAPKTPYILIDNRILDPGNLFIPVKENTDLTVSCVVDGGNPKPALSWDISLSGSSALLDGPDPLPYQPPNITESVREQKVGARNDARLERIMRGHHNATLTCIVHHLALLQPLNVSLLLDVQYTPSFAISREPGFGFPVREGMPVSLKCDVDANPKAAPIWQKDDTDPPVQQTHDGFLNFTEIRREHSGWYKCISRHLLGRFSSIGYFLNVRYDMEVTQEPDFDVGELSSPGRQLEVALGGAVQLACPPGITGCWTRVDQGTGRVESLGASQELRLDQVVYQEAGEYRCIAPSKDTVRKLESLKSALNVHVVVTGQPMIFPVNQTLTGVHGQPLTLSMEFCANPMYSKVLWIAKDRIYRPGEADTDIVAYAITNSSATNCYQAVLYIRKVRVMDIGEYSLVVRSPHGLAEGIFNVNMTYASGYNVKNLPNEAVENSAIIIVLPAAVVVLTLLRCVHVDLHSFQ